MDTLQVMAGKRIRSRNSQNSIPVTNLTNRTTIQTAKVTNTVGLKVPDDLLTLTKEQLKAECRRRGQKTTGTKVELVCLELCVSYILHVFLCFYIFFRLPM